MRTLLVSDLHLGKRPGRDTLSQAGARGRLLRALDDVDRLVLLGDVVELGSRAHRRRALDVAGPVLREIGARMGPEREIVLVAGNHDGILVRDWVRARGDALGLDDEVPGDATGMLAAVVSMLTPARVSVHYPGLWVRDDVWATHGHYLDRHLAPESTFGLPRRRPAHPPGDVRPQDYERARRRRARRRRERERASRGPWSRLRERPLATVLEHVVELGLRAAGLLRAVDLASLTSRVLDLQARHAAVPALGRVVGELGVDARWVVFGHIHRAGPDPGARWPGSDGVPRLLNTGSWAYEPLLLAHAAAPHPYWPGGAVVVGETGDPEVLHLLDDLDGGQLGGGARR